MLMAMNIPKLDDPIEITVARARRLYWAVVAGVVWSLFYTAVSLFLMNDLATQVENECVVRQAVRTEVREVLLEAPFLSDEDKSIVDLTFPAEVGC